MAEQFPFDLERTARRAAALRDEKSQALGRFIRTLRERDDKSREDIAEGAGIPVDIIFRLENGIEPFDELDQEILRALAKGMREVLPGCKDLSVHALCEGSGFSLEDLPLVRPAN